MMMAVDLVHAATTGDFPRPGGLRDQPSIVGAWFRHVRFMMIGLEELRQLRNMRAMFGGGKGGKGGKAQHQGHGSTPRIHGAGPPRFIGRD